MPTLGCALPGARQRTEYLYDIAAWRSARSCRRAWRAWPSPEAPTRCCGGVLPSALWARILSGGRRCVSLGVGRVAQLLIPVSSAALGGEVEQVPQRLDCANMPGILPWIGGCVKQLRAPEVTDSITA